MIRLHRLCFASMAEKIVIVGGGQASAQAVDTLRRKGFKGTLSLVAEEPVLPYQRPPLSKKFLAGQLAPHVHRRDSRPAPRILLRLLLQKQRA